MGNSSRVAIGIAAGVAVALLVTRERAPDCDGTADRATRAQTRTVLTGMRPTSLGPAAFSGMALPPPPPPAAGAAGGGDAVASSSAAAVAGTCTLPDGRLTLAIGIITAPSHFDRRLWIRQKLRVSDACARGVRVLFVLGSRNKMTRPQRIAIRHEERAHGDIIFVEARDWVPHAVAEKSLAWWEYAERHLKADWYAKTDDDSLMHLPRVESDLAAMAALGRSHYYYGVMTWRAWYPFHTVADAACGDRGDDGPKVTGASGRLKKLIAVRRAGGECEAALGPYPFADGSLQALSADLLTSFVTDPLTTNFSATHRANERAPFWTHEDAAVGYLIYHAAIRQKLPVTYVVLSAWKHNKFWINWYPRDNPSLPDGHVVNTHKIVTSMMATIANDAYLNTTYKADPIHCVDCAAKWGWQDCFDSKFGRAPIEKFGCCSKHV